MRIPSLAFLAVVAALPLQARADNNDVPTRFNEATIAQLQAQMASGRTTSVELTDGRRVRLACQANRRAPTTAPWSSRARRCGSRRMSRRWI